MSNAFWLLFGGMVLQQNVSSSVLGSIVGPLFQLVLESSHFVHIPPLIGDLMGYVIVVVVLLMNIVCEVIVGMPLIQPKAISYLHYKQQYSKRKALFPSIIFASKFFCFGHVLTGSYMAFVRESRNRTNAKRIAVDISLILCYMDLFSCMLTRLVLYLYFHLSSFIVSC